MEVIIIITKEVADQAEAETFAQQTRSFIANNPPLNNPDLKINIETRNNINQE